MCIFNFPHNLKKQLNQLKRLHSRGPDASLDTHNEGIDQLWRLWQLWPYPQFGHYGIMAIAALVDQRHQYRCLMKRLDLRIAASEANLA